MIQLLRLNNFKCFDHVEVPFSPLTILSGVNGSGKSSVLQAILLVRQSVDMKTRQISSLELRGSRIEIGSGEDILHEDADEDFLEFQINATNGGSVCTKFAYDREADRLSAETPSEFPSGFALLDDPLITVPADRQGPQRVYPLSQLNAETYQFGQRAEFALSLLASVASKLIDEDDPRRSDCDSRRIVDLVNFYIASLSPGASLISEKLALADAIIAQYRFERPGDAISKGFKPINVGFGLSSTMPVIIALISAPKGSTLLIENPEAHLHPRGQTELGYLCARTAAAGVQVVVETHSDHFLNGVRISAKRGIIRSEDVSFPFFVREGTKSSILTPKLLADGRLDFWPEGFFDQHEQSLIKLL